MKGNAKDRRKYMRAHPEKDFVKINGKWRKAEVLPVEPAAEPLHYVPHNLRTKKYYSYEGKYLCECIVCEAQFIGDKRDPVCGDCDSKGWDQSPDSLTVEIPADDPDHTIWREFTQDFDYYKKFYDVKFPDNSGYEMCWPNAGKMNTLDGKQVNPGPGVMVRLSTKHPMDKGTL